MQYLRPVFLVTLALSFLMACERGPNESRESENLVSEINNLVADLNTQHGLSLNASVQVFSDEIKATAMAAGLWGLYDRNQLPVIRSKLVAVSAKSNRVLEIWNGFLMKVPAESFADMVKIHRNANLYLRSMDRYTKPAH